MWVEAQEICRAGNETITGVELWKRNPSGIKERHILGTLMVSVFASDS